MYEDHYPTSSSTKRNYAEEMSNAPLLRDMNVFNFRNC